MTDPELILHTITVTHRLNSDGIETYSIDYSGEIGWLQGLGLLEAAKFDLYDRCKSNWDGSEDNE